MPRKDTRSRYEFDTIDEAYAFAQGVEQGAGETGGSASAEVMQRRQKGVYVVKVEYIQAEGCDCPRYDFEYD